MLDRNEHPTKLTKPKTETKLPRLAIERFALWVVKECRTEKELDEVTAMVKIFCSSLASAITNEANKQWTSKRQSSSDV